MFLKLWEQRSSLPEVKALRTIASYWLKTLHSTIRERKQAHHGIYRDIAEPEAQSDTRRIDDQ